MKNQGKLIFSIIIIILVVIFALQNTNVVAIDLFFAKYEVPLVLVILLSLLLGVIVGLIGSYSAIVIQKKEKLSAVKELNLLKETNLIELADKSKEILHLRNQVKELKEKNNNTMTLESASTVTDEE